ncbi:MAG: hypothetical protein ACOZQL_13070 [Myxococcota bacterium]
MQPDLQQQVLGLAKRAELRALTPTGMLAKMRPGEALPTPGEQFDLHLRVATGMTRTPDGFIGVATISVQAQRKAAKRAFARFVYRVNVHYVVPGEVADDAAQLFVQTNGLVHVWPYARAWLQSTSVSMGLTGVLLPFYRVQAPNALKLEPESK